MTILNFPAGPVDGAIYTVNGISYVYNNGAWSSNSAESNNSLYVNVDGDNMTGDLTLGTDKIVLDAGNGNITAGGKIEGNKLQANDRIVWGADLGNYLNSNGDSNFSGSITAAGNVTTGVGITFPDGTTQITAASGGGGGDGEVGSLLEVCTVGNFTSTDINIGNSVVDPRIQLKESDGSITAAGSATFDSYVISNSSFTVYNPSAASEGIQVYGAYANNVNTFSVKSSGSITAAGKVVIGVGTAADAPTNFALYGYSNNNATNVGTINAKNWGTGPSIVGWSGDGYDRFRVEGNGQVYGYEGAQFGNSVFISDRSNPGTNSIELNTNGNITATGNISVSGFVEGIQVYSSANESALNFIGRNASDSNAYTFSVTGGGDVNAAGSLTAKSLTGRTTFPTAGQIGETITVDRIYVAEVMNNNSTVLFSPSSTLTLTPGVWCASGQVMIENQFATSGYLDPGDSLSATVPNFQWTTPGGDATDPDVGLSMIGSNLQSAIILPDTNVMTLTISANYLITSDIVLSGLNLHTSAYVDNTTAYASYKLDLQVRWTAVRIA